MNKASIKKLSLFFIFFTFSLVSCTKDEKTSDDTLRIALGSNVSSLDPAIAFDQVSLRVVYQIYETLFEYDYNSNETKIIPLLAASMPEVSQDKLTYTVKIKKGIKYHPHPALKNDRTVTAQDFINQIKRLAYTPTRSQGYWLFEGKIKGINKFKSSARNLDDFFNFQIEGLKVIDQTTFQIKLKKPYPQIMYALSLVFVTPIPKEVILETKNNLSEKTVGTGPYTLKTFKRSHLIELTKFNSHHQKNLARIKNIKMPFMKESQTRWLNFRKNKIDFFGLGKDHFNLALDKKGELRTELKQEKISLYKQNSLTYWWLSFNMKDPTIKEMPFIKKAIAHAINWDKYISIFTNNTAIKANSIYHPVMFGYKEKSNSYYEYNPAKSIEILTQAGFSDTKKLPTLSFDTRTVGKSALQEAEFIKSELKKVGINIKIQTNTFPAFLKKARKGNLQLWQDGWGLDYPDSENVLQLLQSKNHPPGVNTSYFDSPLVDELFSKLASMENTPEKAQVMKAIEDHVKENYTWLMQFYSRGFTLYKSRVKNFKPSSLTNNYYKHLYLEN